MNYKDHITLEDEVRNSRHNNKEDKDKFIEFNEINDSQNRDIIERAKKEIEKKKLFKKYGVGLLGRHITKKLLKITECNNNNIGKVQHCRAFIPVNSFLIKNVEEFGNLINQKNLNSAANNGKNVSKHLASAYTKNITNLQGHNVNLKGCINLSPGKNNSIFINNQINSQRNIGFNQLTPYQKYIKEKFNKKENLLKKVYPHSIIDFVNHVPIIVPTALPNFNRSVIVSNFNQNQNHHRHHNSINHQYNKSISPSSKRRQNLIPVASQLGFTPFTPVTPNSHYKTKVSASQSIQDYHRNLVESISHNEDNQNRIFSKNPSLKNNASEVSISSLINRMPSFSVTESSMIDKNQNYFINSNRVYSTNSPMCIYRNQNYYTRKQIPSHVYNVERSSPTYAIRSKLNSRVVDKIEENIASLHPNINNSNLSISVGK